MTTRRKSIAKKKTLSKYTAPKTIVNTRSRMPVKSRTRSGSRTRTRSPILELTLSPVQKYREEAISWMLHSLKIILGDQGIRRYIITKYYPKLSNPSPASMRTFDAFIPIGKTRADKANEIIAYCKSMMRKKGTVVFTATNIQTDEFDNETHFQSYLLDNAKHRLLVIDPAYDATQANHMGIYYAEVTEEVIGPFFQNNRYTVEYIELTHPAQIHQGDVFCQSWSLLILLQKLKNNEYVRDKTFTIPVSQIDKYEMLLSFYKQIFVDLPELCDNLRIEYKGEVNTNVNVDKHTQMARTLLEYDPVDLLMSMNASDI